MGEVEDKETLARAQLPYRAEYCKTSRAKCKKCQDNMSSGSLKLAYMSKSRFHDGYDAAYFHVECFFLVKRPSSVAEIGHFETLKYEDQKMLEKAIESNGKSVLGSVTTSTIEKEGKKSKSKKVESVKRAVVEDVNYQDFSVEYSKSSRAKCNTCQENIPKNEIRFAKMDYTPNDTPGVFGPLPRWHHMNCFAKSLEQLEFFGLVEKIPNFDQLEQDDQSMLKKTIKPIKPPSSCDDDSPKKMKIENEMDAQEERALKQQSKRFHYLRDKLNEIRKSEIEELLEFNDQKHNFKASTLALDLAADILLFGPLKPCPKCKVPRTMVLRNSSYICTNGANTDKPCDYETREPQRTVPDFPDEFTENHPFFAEKYEFIPGKRIFPKNLLKAVEQKEAENNNLVQEGAPLEGLSIGVISWSALRVDKEKVQKKVITLGGRITTVIDSSIFVILSNKNELDKLTPKIEVAKELGIPFAKEDFLFVLKDKEDVVPQLTKCLIGDWEGKLKKRYREMAARASGSQS